jgi:imidazolonepropionase-like amidohydrolase
MAMTQALLWAALAALASGPQAPARAADTYAVQAKELWLGDGQRVEDGVLLVEGGKIKAVGRGVEVPAGTPRLTHDGVLSAGLVAFDCRVGLDGEASEPKRSVLPEGRVVDVFDSGDEGVGKALAEGITALVLAPAPSTLVGGRCAVVKTAHGAVLAPESHLALSLCDQALDANRYPTSPSGAMVELERLLDEGHGAFGAAASGRLPVLIEVSSRADVARALTLVERHELQGVLTGADRAGELADALAASGLGVAVGPFTGGTSQRALDSVLALAAAKVPLAFALEAPARHPASLRLSAALAIRAGLDPALAWNALTSGAAAAAGVGARVGRLERGLDADFVLWSGDPLDLGNRPVAVFVDGVRVYHGGER